jgi:hypothetical protein
MQSLRFMSVWLVASLALSLAIVAITKNNRGKPKDEPQFGIMTLAIVRGNHQL